MCGELSVLLDGKAGLQSQSSVSEIIGQLWMAEFELRPYQGVEPIPRVSVKSPQCGDDGMVSLSLTLDRP